MKVVKKILLSLLAIPLVLVAVLVALQTYYHVTPVALSAEALELNARAAKLPTLTENGYRFYGLMAPREQDAVVFGKCLFDAQAQHRREDRDATVKLPSHEDKPAWEAYEKTSAARSKFVDEACLKGGTRLTLPTTLADVRVNLATTEEQWQLIAAAIPDETVKTRADAVRGGGVRRLGAEVDSPFLSYENLLKIERWRIARGVEAWRSNDRPQATELWRAAIAEWAQSADSTLIEAVLSVAAQTQVLIAMQGTVVQANRIDDATAESLLAAIKPIETMPHAVANSMLAEWQTHESVIKQMIDNPMRSMRLGAERNGYQRALDRLALWTFDANDTMNALAKANLWSQDALLKAAQGQAQPEFPDDTFFFGCATSEDWGMACLPFMRNPAGRILSSIAMPAYATYGVRVADLRNFAAATRLTIEVRRRQLAGDAAVQFVASAPADMRDVFSGNAFVYDVASKRLRIELREKSTILGEKGATYELRL